jgi:hypothetical protein
MSGACADPDGGLVFPDAGPKDSDVVDAVVDSAGVDTAAEDTEPPPDTAQGAPDADATPDATLDTGRIDAGAPCTEPTDPPDPIPGAAACDMLYNALGIPISIHGCAVLPPVGEFNGCPWDASRDDVSSSVVGRCLRGLDFATSCEDIDMRVERCPCVD